MFPAPTLTPEQREKMAQALADRGLEAIESASEEQEAVDASVAIVDGCLKVGATATPDQALATIDPEVMPVEVVLAFLTTTASASSRLPREDFVPFEQRAHDIDEACWGEHLADGQLFVAVRKSDEQDTDIRGRVAYCTLQNCGSWRRLDAGDDRQ